MRASQDRDVHDLDREILALVKRRDNKLDCLISDLIEVDTISQRVDVLLDRRCALIDDGR